MDDRIHPAQRVHLVGDLAGLRHVVKVTDDHLGPSVDKVADRVDTIGVAHGDDDTVAGPQEFTCRGLAEAVGRPGDEDPHADQLVTGSSTSGEGRTWTAAQVPP